MYILHFSQGKFVRYNPGAAQNFFRRRVNYGWITIRESFHISKLCDFFTFVPKHTFQSFTLIKQKFKPQCVICWDSIWRTKSIISFILWQWQGVISLFVEAIDEKSFRSFAASRGHCTLYKLHQEKEPINMKNWIVIVSDTRGTPIMYHLYYKS